MGNDGIFTKYKTKAYIITFASLLVILLAISFFIPSENIVINVDGNAMELSYSRTQFGRRNILETDVLELRKIETLELKETFAYGEQVDGIQSRDCMAGIWDDGYGEYQLFAYTQTQHCITIQTIDRARYVINFESNEATKAFYDALMLYINNI